MASKYLIEMVARSKKMVQNLLKGQRCTHRADNGVPCADGSSEAMCDTGNATAMPHKSRSGSVDNDSRFDRGQTSPGEKEDILESQARKLAQAEEMLGKLQAENARLTSDNRALSMRLSDMEVQIEKSRHLEISSAELLDWIQSVIGYAGNKDLFPSDSDELSQFRDDAKKLPSILRTNGITCDNNPPDEGLGFVRKRDSRISNRQVLAAPMLLRDGVIVAEGILLIPANDNAYPQTPSAQRTPTAEPSLTVSGGVADETLPQIEANTDAPAKSPYQFDF